ncbi:DMT family transporter [Salaquimonas pukyongi]|uniref:DMT family transporter n=1 Tax=Salaquimonas pukyongi TaxID=2712698 RepID=UPI00096BCEBD|nr:DMT family transporter [Salaquimonas pukyongi]
MSGEKVLHKQPELSFALAFALLVMGAIAMGVSPVFVRFSEVGPFSSAFWRVFLSLPVLFAWACFEARRAGRQLTWDMDRAILLTGLFFAGDLIFWHLAIHKTTMANATLMATLAPVWVALFSGTFIGEPVPRRTWLGLALCLMGAALLIGSSYQLAPERIVGDLYGVITSLFFGLYFLAVRVARRNHKSGEVTLLSTIVTTVILFGTAIISGQKMLPDTAQGVASLIALGTFSHAGGQGLLAIALGSLSAAFSSLVIFVEALAAAFFGWAVFGETLSPMQFAGAAMILTGIWVARPKT